MSKRKIKRFFASIVCVFIPVRRIRHQVTDAIMKDHGDKRAYIKIKQEWLARYNGQKLIPGRFEKYDLIFGIGSGCHVRNYLDANHLVRFTTPLDWIGGRIPQGWGTEPGLERDSRFNEKIHFLCNDFDGWANPSDFYTLQQSDVRETLHHYVLNVKTNVRFVHAFPCDTSMELHMPKFIEAMHRRANRLLDAIAKSDKILIVWAHRLFDQRDCMDAIVSDQDIIQATEKLNARFPGKQIDIVFFEHNGYKDKYQFDKTKICTTGGVEAYRLKTNHHLYGPEYARGDKYSFVYNNNVVYYISMGVAEALDNIGLTDKLAAHR